MSALRILITGNCLRYDIAAQLTQWLPAVRIITDVLPGADDLQAHGTLRGLVADSDLWLTMGTAEFTQQFLERMSGTKPAVCRIPVPGFAAFHPDICFAINGDTGVASRQVFNSAIGAWAYRQGLNASDAATLFNADHFRALGYFNAWAGSVAYLREAFANSDLAANFNDFLYAVKRNGCFMQTFNHPTPAAMARLCTLICQRCGLEPLSDSLLPLSSSPASRLIWPVYQEIAQTLGVSGGSYIWQMDGHQLGLEAFLQRTFNTYAEQGIAPRHLQLLNRDWAGLDKILAPETAQL